MRTELPYDPEFTALLVELAGDPDSKLLRARPGKRFRGIPGITEPIRATEPSLSKLERHLLRVYREELGLLLRQASQKAFHEDPALQGKVYRDPERLEQIRKVDRTWSARVRALKANCPEFSGSELSELLVADPKVAGDVPSFIDYVEAAFRVLPCDSLRIRRAQAIWLQGYLQEAISQLERLLATSPSEEIKAFALYNIGALRDRQWDSKRALEACRLSAQLEGKPLVAATSWLKFACIEGLRSEALQAARLVDDSLDENHPSVLVCLPRPDPENAWGGGWRPTPASKALYPRIEDHIGPASRRIARAYA